MKAVITADIVGSGKISLKERTKLLDSLHEGIQVLQSWHPCEYVIMRGDGMQGILDEPKAALRHAIFLKSLVKSFVSNSGSRIPAFDIRISIGVGNVNFRRPNLLESDGEAFQLSGRAIDEMKTKQKTFQISFPNNQEAEAWDVISLLADALMSDWSIASAEAIYHLVQGKNEHQTADILNISQPAVNSRKKKSYWSEIESMILYFEALF
ncbi:MAG: hypothetical protein R2879_21770 [Saprospiraceae bacterium]